LYFEDIKKVLFYRCAKTWWQWIWTWYSHRGPKQHWSLLKRQKIQIDLKKDERFSHSRRVLEAKRKVKEIKEAELIHWKQRRSRLCIRSLEQVDTLYL